MSREIKFRAWKGGRLFDDVCVYDENTIVEQYDGDEWCTREVDCIEQYTGFEDKNGKEIYEGDIAKWHLGGKDNIMVVRWHQPECCFELHFAVGNFADSLLTDDSVKWYEVIGNIHENPELLEGEK